MTTTITESLWEPEKNALDGPVLIPYKTCLCFNVKTADLEGDSFASFRSQELQDVYWMFLELIQRVMMAANSKKKNPDDKPKKKNGSDSESESESESEEESDEERATVAASASNDPGNMCQLFIEMVLPSSDEDHELTMSEKFANLSKATDYTFYFVCPQLPKQNHPNAVWKKMIREKVKPPYRVWEQWKGERSIEKMQTYLQAYCGEENESREFRSSMRKIHLIDNPIGAVSFFSAANLAFARSPDGLFDLDGNFVKRGNGLTCLQFPHWKNVIRVPVSHISPKKLFNKILPGKQAEEVLSFPGLLARIYQYEMNRINQTAHHPEEVSQLQRSLFEHLASVAADGPSYEVSSTAKPFTSYTRKKRYVANGIVGDDATNALVVGGIYEIIRTYSNKCRDFLITQLNQETDEDVDKTYCNTIIDWAMNEFCLEKYIKYCRGAHPELLSECGANIMNAIESERLYDKIDEVSEMMDTNISAQGNFWIKWVTALNEYFHIREGCSNAFNLWIGSLDSYRIDEESIKRMHFTMMLMAEAGGIGKSYVIDFIISLMLKGSVLDFAYQSAKAMTGGDSQFCVQEIIKIDEFDPTKVDPERGGEMAALWRMERSECRVSGRVAHVNPRTGKREQQRFGKTVVNTVLTTSNSRRMWQTMGTPEYRRLFVICQDERKEVSNVAQAIIQKMMTGSDLRPQQTSFIRAMQQRQALFMEVNGLIACGAIKPVTRGILVPMISYAFAEFQNAGYHVFNWAMEQFIYLVENLVILRAINAVFFDKGCPHDPTKPIDPHEMMLVSRHLTVYVEDFVMGMGSFNRLIDEYMHVIVPAIKYLCDEQDRNDWTGGMVLGTDVTYYTFECSLFAFAGRIFNVLAHRMHEVDLLPCVGRIYWSLRMLDGTSGIFSRWVLGRSIGEQIVPTESHVERNASMTCLYSDKLDGDRMIVRVHRQFAARHYRHWKDLTNTVIMNMLNHRRQNKGRYANGFTRDGSYVEVLDIPTPKNDKVLKVVIGSSEDAFCEHVGKAFSLKTRDRSGSVFTTDSSFDSIASEMRLHELGIGNYPIDYPDIVLHPDVVVESCVAPERSRPRRPVAIDDSPLHVRPPLSMVDDRFDMDVDSLFKGDDIESSDGDFEVNPKRKQRDPEEYVSESEDDVVAIPPLRNDVRSNIQTDESQAYFCGFDVRSFTYIPTFKELWQIMMNGKTSTRDRAYNPAHYAMPDGSLKSLFGKFRQTEMTVEQLKNPPANLILKYAKLPEAEQTPENLELLERHNQLVHRSICSEPVTMRLRSRILAGKTKFYPIVFYFNQGVPYPIGGANPNAPLSSIRMIKGMPSETIPLPKNRKRRNVHGAFVFCENEDVNDNKVPKRPRTVAENPFVDVAGVDDKVFDHTMMEHADDDPEEKARLAELEAETDQRRQQEGNSAMDIGIL